MKTKTSKLLQAPNGVEFIQFWIRWEDPQGFPFLNSPEIGELNRNIADYVKGRNHQVFMHYEKPDLGAFVIVNPLNIPDSGYLIQ